MWVRDTVTAVDTVTADLIKITIFTLFEAIRSTQYADTLKTPRNVYERGLRSLSNFREAKHR